MPFYRTYFLGEDDHIRAAEEIEAEDVEQVVRQSLSMLEQRPQHHAIEIWQEGRRVYPSSSAPAMEDETVLDPELARQSADTAAFLRLAAVELRRLAERAPEIADELLQIARQSEAQAGDLIAHLPRSAREEVARPVAAFS